jgi:hypothetical protein
MRNKTIKWEHGRGGYSLKVGTVTPLTLAMMSLSKENVEVTDDQMKDCFPVTFAY